MESCFEFKPSIDYHPIITLHRPQSNHSIVFYFYAFEKNKNTNHQLIPEIWTDLQYTTCTSTSTDWIAIPLKPLDDDYQSPPLVWFTQLNLINPLNSFTFRLIDPNPNSNQIIWLGSPDQNGSIQLIQHSVDPHQLILSSIRELSTDHHLSTTWSSTHHHHLFTFKLSTSDPLIIPIHLPTHLQSIQFEGLAFHRSKPTWLDPHPFNYLSEISSAFDSQSIILADPSDPDQKLLILIPISTNHSSTTIRSTALSHLTICTTTTIDPSEQPLLIIKLIVIHAPRSQLKYLINPSNPSPSPSPSPQKQILNQLGYCTWDSLGPNYKISQVIQVLESFQTSGIENSIDRILLDDGWQDVRGSTLSSWQAKEDWMDLDHRGVNQSEPYHSNLARAIQFIRDHPSQSIQKVGVWLTITGYWDGLDPESETMKEFKLQRWSVSQSSQSTATHWMLPSRSCISSFWETYFEYLKSAGVQFIKIDNQAGLDRLICCESDPSEDVNIYKTTLIDAVEDLSRRYFGSENADYNVIHSMAHAPQILFRENPYDHSSKGKKREPMGSKDEDDQRLRKKLMRTSDDYFPDLIEQDGHCWHILSNAFNSIWANGLGLTADFDMMMSQHVLGDYHAAFRAFSSAPIYLTDRVGQHDLSIIHKLTAQLKKSKKSSRAIVQPISGAGCVISSQCLGQAARDLSLGNSAWGLLKVGLSASYAGGGLIGIWNVKKQTAQGDDGSQRAVDVITARDIAEVMDDEQPLTGKAHDTKKKVLSGNNRLVIFNSPVRFKVIEEFDLNSELYQLQCSSKPMVATVLEKGGFEIWRLARFLDLPDHQPSSHKIQVASLGLMNQYVGLCAVSVVDQALDDRQVKSSSGPPPTSSGSSSPSASPAAAGAKSYKGAADQHQQQDGGLVGALNSRSRGGSGGRSTDGEGGTSNPYSNLARRASIRTMVCQLVSSFIRWLLSLMPICLRSIFCKPRGSANGRARTDIDDDRSSEEECEERTPLLRDPEIKREHDSTPNGLDEDDGKDRVRFVTPYSDSIGFVVRLEGPGRMADQGTSVWGGVDELIEIRVDRCPLDLPSPSSEANDHQESVVEIGVLDAPPPTTDSATVVVLLLISIHLARYPASPPHSGPLWTVEFRAKSLT